MNHSTITHKCDDGQLARILRAVERCCGHRLDSGHALILLELEEIKRTVHANEAMLLKISKELFEPTIIFTPGTPKDKEL